MMIMFINKKNCQNKVKKNEVPFQTFADKLFVKWLPREF